MPRLRHAARGGATLIVVLVLLLSAGLVSLALNRHVLTEQRSSAATTRSTIALETAEAGLEWALGQLNDGERLDAQCRPSKSEGSESLRVRYLLRDLDAVPSSAAFAPDPAALVGCRLEGRELTCSCPSPGQPLQIGTAEAPSFVVSFEPAASDAVRVVARGCAADTRACTPDDMAMTDAHAVVQALFKIKPLQMPASPLTCGGSCTVGGSYNLINRHVPTNGILVNAGGEIVFGEGAKQLLSLPGTPAGAALVPHDDSLAALKSNDPSCEGSAMFKTYVGMSLAEYRDSPLTTRLSCTSANDCKAKLMEAYGKGERAFYFDSDVKLAGNGTIGSATQPVLFATPNALSLSGGWTIYGLVFSNSADITDNGTGSASIRGAQIACADYSNNGNGTTEYDAEALDNLRGLASPLHRVPGSWRDF